jgi:hypothetical protein
LRDTFPAQQLAVSQGVFAIGIILGPALGPTLGGYLVDNYSWNWCFDINILPGTIATVLLLIFLRDPTAPRRTRVDIIGLMLLATTLFTMQYVFTEGERNYWFADGTIDVMSLLCVISLVAFAWWELWKSEVPIVDLRVFQNRSSRKDRSGTLRRSAGSSSSSVPSRSRSLRPSSRASRHRSIRGGFSAPPSLPPRSGCRRRLASRQSKRTSGNSACRSCWSGFPAR